VLHSVDGNLGWRSYLRPLAQQCTVYALTLPGFGVSERPPWLESCWRRLISNVPRSSATSLADGWLQR
jgi:hypothetical protein